MAERKNILVCPLDWGIGHATRCVPVIDKLIENNVNVIIAADNRPLAFLKNEFKQLHFIKFPGYNFKYPRKGNMSFKMFILVPVFFYGIFKEYKLLKKIIKDYKIDGVISDNRYGLWNNTVPCIFLTHQIFIKSSKKLKFFESILYKLNKFFINKYNECWIPDFKGEKNISGDLSHKEKIPQNAYYIGPLSRFYKQSKNNKTEKIKYDILVILSGPEPQRTILEEKILGQLNQTKLKTVIVRGITDENEEIKVSDNVKIYSHLETAKLINYIRQSKIIICRPGYSSIMDLIALGKNAVFIPTPGQTEQEYLSEYFFNKKIFYSVKQNNFDIMQAIDKSSDFQCISFDYDPLFLDERIDVLISNI